MIDWSVTFSSSHCSDLASYLHLSSSTPSFLPRPFPFGFHGSHSLYQQLPFNQSTASIWTSWLNDWGSIKWIISSSCPFHKSAPKATQQVINLKCLSVWSGKQIALYNEQLALGFQVFFFSHHKWTCFFFFFSKWKYRPCPEFTAWHC